MATVNQEFPSAPMGGRVIRTVILSVVIFLVIVVAATWSIARLGSRGLTSTMILTAVGAPLVGLLMMVPIFLYERSRVAMFTIKDDCLLLGGKSYPLRGAVAIARDPDIMKWAMKLYGNGGLGAIRGRFWSKRVGTFQASLTDADYAVVLRWPDRVIAVSPADPEYFITCAKSAAGIR
jgi:hypothetical protein